MDRPQIFLHVGSPKTGTTFLQQVLWSQKERAAAQGLLLPLDRFHDHFFASLDLRELVRPPHPPEAAGAWHRLVRAAADHKGPVLVSHELFSAANASQAKAATRSFGSHAEVHVVITARDYVRQLSAEWQEHVKHRATASFEEFVTGVREGAPERTGWFWRVQDYAGIAERWGAALPPGNVHVVTVPPVGADPGLLWQRFAGLLGLDPASFDTEGHRSNTSLGMQQAEVLRRVNAALGERLPIPGPYPAVVKDLLAHQVLAARAGTRLTLSPADTEFALEECRATADRLAALGVDVVGSLDELVPDADLARAAASEDAYRVPADAELLAESVAALADLLVDLSERNERHRLDAEVAESVRVAPLRTALTQASEEHPSLARAKGAFDRLRGR